MSSVTKFFSFLLWHRYFFAGSLILAGAVLAVFWEFKIAIPESKYFIAAGVIVAVIQYERNKKIQHVKFVKDYMSSLLSNEEFATRFMT